MTSRTRYFAVASLLVLGVGVVTGLVAYYTGTSAQARRGPDELRFVPSEAAVIAYANVHDVMQSELRQRVHQAMPLSENGQQEFQNQTGINIETDIDRIVACLDTHSTGGPTVPAAGMILARGRFDPVKIEALMRDHGARVDDYKGNRLIVADFAEARRLEAERKGADVDVDAPARPSRHGESLAVAFLETDLAAVGSPNLVRAAIDLQKGEPNSQSVLTNDELMNLVRSLDSGNAWAVGRFDVLRAKANLPESVASQLPPITWFSVSGHVNGGLSAIVRADTRDEESANNLRDVVRGFMALAKMQASARPELQAFIQSLELGGTGKSVALSFSVPAQVFDLMAPAAKHGEKPPAH